MLYTFYTSGNGRGSYTMDKERIAQMPTDEAAEFESFRWGFNLWLHPTWQNIRHEEQYEIRRELSRAMHGKWYGQAYEKVHNKNLLTDIYNRNIRELESEIEALADITHPKYVAQRKSLQAKLEKKRKQNIYIAKIGRQVKVGVTVDIDSRMRALRNETYHVPEPLFVFPGDEQIEGMIYNTLTDYVAKPNRGREWFSAKPVLKSFADFTFPEDYRPWLASINPDVFGIDTIYQDKVERPHLDSKSHFMLRSYGMYGKSNHYVRP